MNILYRQTHKRNQVIIGGQLGIGVEVNYKGQVYIIVGYTKDSLVQLNNGLSVEPWDLERHEYRVPREFECHLKTDKV